MLTERQQILYSRHLLLEGFDQERLCALRVRVIGEGQGAAWARRYLAACGVQVIESGNAEVIEITGGAVEGARAAMALIVRIAA